MKDNIIQKYILLFLYSLLILFLFFSSTYISTYVTEEIGFRWGRTHLIIMGIIFLFIIFKKNTEERTNQLLKDKYLIVYLLIFIWSILSSLFSVQVTMSLKKTISMAIVFFGFYIVPRYYLSKGEREYFISSMLYPLVLFISIISILNILHYLGLIDMGRYIPLWTTKETIFENSNTFGVRIMFTLMLLNVYLILNKNFQNRYKNRMILKICFLINYLLIVLNLLFSGSRASFLGLAIALLPILYAHRKKVLITIIPIGFFLLNNKNIYLIRKLSKGTSGRSTFWIYALKEVIPKYLFLGVGSGAFDYHIGNKFNVIYMHNSYLDVIMSNGVVGFLLWSIILAFVFSKILKSKNNKSIFLFTILGILAYSFFEVGIFDELGIKMAITWTFIQLIEEDFGVKIPEV